MEVAANVKATTRASFPRGMDIVDRVMTYSLEMMRLPVRARVRLDGDTQVLMASLTTTAVSSTTPSVVFHQANQITMHH
jgi:hypothetical protein